MKVNKTIIGSIVVILMTMVSCIDKGYDLGNIDKSKQIAINDLVVPLQLDDIMLKSVKEIDNNRLIKKINGEYAVVKEGSLLSTELDIPSFSTSSLTRKTSMPPLMKEVNSSSSEGDVVSYYDFSETDMSLRITSNFVDKSINSIDSADVSAIYSISLFLDTDRELTKYLKNIVVEDIEVDFPSGMKGTACAINTAGDTVGCSYDYNTGIMKMHEPLVTPNGTVTLQLNLTGFTVDILGGTVTKGKGTNIFTLNRAYTINKGRIAVHKEDFKQTAITVDDLPDSVSCRMEESFKEFEMLTFSGEVDYAISNLKVDAMDLSDLPKSLKEEGTNMILDNPQIYLKVINPLEDKSVTGTISLTTEFKFIAVGQDGTEKVYSSDDGEIYSVSRNNQFYLSPKEVTEFYEGYTDPAHIEFKQLSNILSGKGIPDRIIVDSENTRVKDVVEGVELGKNYGRVTGEYVLYAPLDLKENSTLIYTDTIDGWSDKKEIQKLTVTKLSVTGNVYSELPFDMELEIWPIDSLYNRLSESGYTTIACKAQGQVIDFEINGNIKNMDGIIIRANALSKEPETLRPEMSIRIESLRPKVSGYYEP